MENKTTDILAEVAAYYSATLAAHGETPLGVDWNSEEGQKLRFGQLSKVIHDHEGVSVNDLGCGYGAFLDYMSSCYGSFAYTGCDVSADMIHAARKLNVHRTNARFVVAAEPPEFADFGIASGIFNVRLGFTDSEWREYLEATIGVLDRTSRRGFAFNCLTSYSDADKRRENLYYADPCALFDLCKKRFSRHVALLHDYGLYEFTILVRKVL
ncbi:MAG: class I SAM-dependent methyltransferase [Acidobacteria bacterium]|nr:class I SAM-dependent methyltransferase [Acidobacteriota bacterium]